MKKSNRNSGAEKYSNWVKKFVRGIQQQTLAGRRISKLNIVQLSNLRGKKINEKWVEPQRQKQRENLESNKIAATHYKSSLNKIQFSSVALAVSSFFLVLFLHWSPVAYWAPSDLRSSSFCVPSFCLFILFMGFSRQEYWSGLPFPSPVDHILSELSTMTHLSWVAPHSMA